MWEQTSLLSTVLNILTNNVVTCTTGRELKICAVDITKRPPSLRCRSYMWTEATPIGMERWEQDRAGRLTSKEDMRSGTDNHFDVPDHRCLKTKLLNFVTHVLRGFQTGGPILEHYVARL